MSILPNNREDISKKVPISNAYYRCGTPPSQPEPDENP
jgi:hypothetical protein